MRNLSVVAVVIVALAAGPGYGTVMLWVNTTSSSIPVGGTATISLLAGATDVGVQSVGGYISPSRYDILASSNLWFNSTDFDGVSIPFLTNGAYLAANGNCLVNAWQGSPLNTLLGSMPTPVTVLTYTVTGIAPGSVRLSWHENGPTLGLTWTLDTAGQGGGVAMGSATITVTPEPATLSLLALGGLLLARRRRA